MNAQTNTLFNTIFSQRPETPLTSALNIIQRYNRNLEDYNRNIENYNINFERIIPLLQTVIASETLGPTNTVEFVTHSPNTTNIASILLSLFDLSGTQMNRGLSENDISMNTTVYNYIDPIPLLEEPLLCPITMEQIVSGTSVMRITRCGHIFKEAALLRWFQTRSSCPVCRGSVIVT
jgi:hypothetical protein